MRPGESRVSGACIVTYIFPIQWWYIHKAICGLSHSVISPGLSRIFMVFHRNHQYVLDTPLAWSSAHPMVLVEFLPPSEISIGSHCYFLNTVCTTRRGSSRRTPRSAWRRSYRSSRAFCWQSQSCIQVGSFLGFCSQFTWVLKSRGWLILWWCGWSGQA